MTLPEILIKFEQFPALGVNWIMYDSNGYKEKPNKFVMEAYTRVYENNNNVCNCHIKSIVKPSEVLYIDNPHYCYYKNDKLAVTENFEEIKNTSSISIHFPRAFTEYNSVNKIRINHYYSKSYAEYKEKINKSMADSLNKRFFEEKAVNFDEKTVQDYTMLRFLPYIKQAYKIN